MDFIAAHAQARPGAVALVEDDRRWTWAEFLDRRNRLASALAREHLADCKVPREVSLHVEFPRDSAGKLIKRVLRDPSGADRPPRI